MTKVMKYNIIYRDELLGNAFKKQFYEAFNVEITKGDITQISIDAVVSPSNSFGFMDGGLDYELSEKFGWDLQKQLQNEIQLLPMGELLVGQALVIPTGDAQIPYLISAPTMRIPMSFNIATSVNAYLAMKAILVTARSHPDIQSVAIPGLCTGVGKMPPKIAARQMYMAYLEVELGNRPSFEDFDEARKYQWKLNEDGMIYD